MSIDVTGRGGEYGILEIRREEFDGVEGDPKIKAPLEYGAVLLFDPVAILNGTDLLRPQALSIHDNEVR